VSKPVDAEEERQLGRMISLPNARNNPKIQKTKRHEFRTNSERLPQKMTAPDLSYCTLSYSTLSYAAIQLSAAHLTYSLYSQLLYSADEFER